MRNQERDNPQVIAANALPCGSPLNDRPTRQCSEAIIRNPQSTIRNRNALPCGSPLNDRFTSRCSSIRIRNPQSTIRNSRRRRGALLLEVILALTILFMGMSLIGIQLQTSIKIGYDNERRTQALLLAEAKLAQLDSGAINLQREMGADGVMEGDFGRSFPGFFFRFTMVEHDDLEDIFEVTTEILYGPPEDDLEPGDIEDAKAVLVLYSFRATPPTLNLQRDFGVSDEQIEELAASLPPDLDPLDFSPAAFAEMDLATLMELMPQLLEIFGQGFGFSSAQIQQAMDMGLLDPSNLPTGPESFNPSQFQGGQQPRRNRPDEGDTLGGSSGARPRPRGGERKDPTGRGGGRDGERDGERPRPRGGGRP